MIYSKTRLQTLFWEIKNRFFYVLLSFFLSFAIAYQNSISLLYLFILSYTTKRQTLFQKKNSLSLTEDEIEGNSFLLLLEDQDGCFSAFNSDFLCNLNESSLLNFSKVVNSVNTASLNFIFTDVEEAFSSQILVCLIFSLAINVPLFVYALLSFLVPSLYHYENKRWISRLFVLFAVWSYFLLNLQNKIIPKLAEFLLKFQITSSAFNVVAETKIYSYCVWACTIFIVTNLLFFCFYLLFFLISNDKIKINAFTQSRKWCRIFLLLISALIVPPDLFLQLGLTFFLILCFELFILVFFIYRYIVRF